MIKNEDLIALQAIIRKEVSRFMRIWVQTLLSPLISRTVYLIIFGKFIGSLVHPIHGISYMSFIVPGIVIMCMMDGAYSNVVSSFCSDKFQRNLEEILVSPAPGWVIISGYVLGGVIRGIVIGVLVFLASLLFVCPQVQNFWIVSFFAIAGVIMVSLIALHNGIFARNSEDEEFYRSFILKPLLYLGGVFYSIQSLPLFCQKISLFNPLMYVINGFRYGFFGFSDVDPYLCLMVMMVSIGILSGSSGWLLNKGVGIKS